MDATAPTPARRRGPKPKGERTMTGAERTRAYRARLTDDQLFEVPEMLGAVALREKLMRALQALEEFEAGRARLPALLDDVRDDMHEGAQYAAQQVWQEVGRRYGFKPAKKRA